ncbi:MAG: sigma-54-dependent Fis family transcriptional regulator [Deltaproteobacteria bacterium]|nr:sigma-54-dependent Fis family transcriptional regulator [Deltaproteobacteria bacterium]
MSKRQVLVVDDEPKMQRILEIMLHKMGHDVLLAADGQEALKLAQSVPIDLVMTDLRMPGMDGVALLTALREHGIEAPVIVLTAHGTVESAVAAMKNGAYDYILRPFDVDAVEIVIRRALALERVQRENQFLREEVEKGWGEFIGRSAAMQQQYEFIRHVANSSTSVLILGESGTGKELAARAIHRASPRREALFVPINCAAIPPDLLESELFGHSKGAFTGAFKERVGKFEMADGGTIFLDEVTEMRPPLQAKLLRVLQEKEVERLGSNRSISIDIRVIAASNQDVRRALQQGTLREDLFYRLNVFTITMPPLRDRVEDVPLLADYFIEKYAVKLGRGRPTISTAALTHLQSYAWPGNVRELENVIERALVLGQGEQIDTRHLPPEIVSAAEPLASLAAPAPAQRLALIPAVEHLEKMLLSQALQQVAGNKAKAARLLDISERTLWYKIKKYGLS